MPIMPRPSGKARMLSDKVMKRSKVQRQEERQPISDANAHLRKRFNADFRR